MTRAHISLKEKLASALCQMLCDDGAGNLVPVIPYEDAKLERERALYKELCRRNAIEAVAA